jgi:hypothetical protein
MASWASCHGIPGFAPTAGLPRPKAAVPARHCQMFPCSLKQFKFKLDLANCHSGPVWLELNNNKKKQQKMGRT